MLKQEEHRGFWHPVDRPDIRFHATLSFSPDKSPRLKGGMTFDAEQAKYLQTAKDITIWGKLLGGQLVTLFQCNKIGLLIPFPGHQDIETNAHTVIFGVHCKQDQAIVHRARVSYTVLSEWMGIFGHQINPTGTMDTAELSYRMPADIPFSINEQLSGAFSFKLHWKNKGPSVIFRQENFLFLDQSEPVVYKKVQGEVWSIQRFLTIATWQQTNISDFAVKVSIPGSEEAEDQFKWCRVFFRQSTYGHAEEENDEYLFRFALLQSSIEPLLQNWFKLETVTEPVISLLIANIGRGDEFVTNNFLNLVQAVEAFHRHVKQDTAQLEAEHQVLMERILQQVCGTEDKKWLEEKLAYAFEPSLRKRLKEIFAQHRSHVLCDKDLSNKEVARLIGLIGDKRNYYTHYGKKLEPKEPDFLQLVTLTQMLRVLLAAMIFRELGMTKEELENRIPSRFKTRLVKKQDNGQES